MTFQDVTNYLNRKNGTSTDFDGYYGAQCADLALDYIVNFLGGPRLSGNAIDFFGQPGSFFEQIANNPSDPNQVPRIGDVIIFRIGSYGHVAICAENVPQGASTFLSLDQNWVNASDNGSPAAFVRHNWNAVVGWLRPKNLSDAVAQPQGGNTTVDTIKSMYLRLLGRDADQDGINHYAQVVAQQGFEFAYNDLKNSAEGQADWQRRNPQRVAQLESENASLRENINSLTDQLTVARNSPQVVEKTVEVPVEKIVYVNQPATPADEQTVVQNWLIRVWNNLFKKESQAMETLKPFLSRKFLLATVTAFVAFGNAFWGWHLTTEQVWQIIVPVLGFIGAEGAADFKSR